MRICLRRSTIRIVLLLPLRAMMSDAVEGACKHVIQSRFKRAGMRWKPPGFLHVLALRLARLNGSFQAFWGSRGLVVQTS
jgi:hypothetical protein